MTRVLFVCLGNICRSPLAEAIFNQLLKERGLEDRIQCDSAGTGDWHVGEPPDPRTLAVARQYQIFIEHRGRQFAPDDFSVYDYIIVMDASNRKNVLAQLPPGTKSDHVHLMRQFDDEPSEQDVPDPYWGGEQGFDDMYHLLRRGCVNLLTYIEAQMPH
jgi:protein-tyrosine phosphatase